MDRWDKLFAVLYFFLGYALFDSLFDFAKMAAFSFMYVAAVSAYCLFKKLPVTGEKIFWTMIVLGIGIPYGSYSIMPFLQFLMLFVAASYWTLVVTDGLMWKNKTSSWVLADIWNGLVSLPVLNFFCQIQVIFRMFQKKTEKKEWKMVLLGIGISIPALMIILPVLSSADAGFAKIVESVFSVFSMREGRMMDFMFRGVMTLAFGGLMFGTLYGGMYGKHIHREICDEWKQESGKGNHLIPDTAVITFSVIICVTYVIFIGLQGKYLFSAFLGILPENFTYAVYARKGFFELCGIAAFNGLLLVLMNNCSRTVRKENKALRILDIMLSVLTLLLIITAMSKMGMYIAAYGFTVKRIQTSVFMAWLFCVFTMTIVLQKKDIPLVRWTVFSGAVFFTFLCIVPIGKLV